MVEISLSGSGEGLGRAIARGYSTTAGAGVLALHGEGGGFLFEARVRASAGDAVELNEEFANRIVTEEELMSDPGGKFVLVFSGTRTNGSDTPATP